MQLYALAELRRQQGRFNEALQTALTAGAVGEQHVPHVGYTLWRGSAAQSALALGDERQALELAQEMLQRAQTNQVLHQMIRSLRVLGRAREGRRACERFGQRSRWACRRPGGLRRSWLWWSWAPHCAGPMSGPRPAIPSSARLTWQSGWGDRSVRAGPLGALGQRRTSPPGGASERASVSHSEERRIAELAGGGQSNRQIAQALFVTPKTVEYHLRNAYRKLGIQGRGQLAEARRADRRLDRRIPTALRARTGRPGR